MEDETSGIEKRLEDCKSLYEDSGDPEELLNFAEELLNLEDLNRSAWDRHYFTAEFGVTEYLSYKPGDPDAWRLLGQLKHQLSKHEGKKDPELLKEVLTCYERALKLDPDDIGLIRMTALFKAELWDFKGALKLLEKQAKIDNRHFAFMDMSRVFEKMGIEEYMVTAGVNKFRYEEYTEYLIGDSYSRNCLIKSAKCLEQALERTKSWSLNERMVAIQNLLGNKEKAREYKARAIEIKTKN